MYIPSIPFPSILEILKALFKFRLFSLNAIYLSENKSFFQFYYRGSEALASLSRKIGGDQSVVFIPSYFCNKSLDDLRNTSAKLVFYKTKLDLTPDWEHIDILAEQYSPNIFVLTHYFGSVNDITPAAKFCENNNCVLIHDCAHHLLPCDEIVNAPGIVIFSPHKVLPLPPLSFVLCDESDFKLLHSPKVTIIKRSEVVWFVKRILQRYFSYMISFKLNNTIPALGGSVLKENWVESNVSLFSLLLLSAASHNLKQVSELRVQNHMLLHKSVLSDNNTHNIKTLKLRNVISPYSYLFSAQVNQQEIIYKRMRNLGIPINTWPDLPPEVINKQNVFSDSIKLRQTILLLPVHQALTKNQVEYIISALLGN